MPKILVGSERGIVPSNTPSSIVARVQIIPSENGKQVIRRNTEHFILLDNSGSMLGSKLDQAKDALIKYCKSINQQDKITIATFSDQVNVIFKNLPVSEMPVEKLIKNVTVEGGTSMYAALSLMYNMIESLKRDIPKSAGSESYKLILLTDGVPTDGSDNEFIQISRKFSMLGVPMYILGIGEDYNEDLLLHMYQANEIGFFKHITNSDDITNTFSDLSKEIILYPSRELNIKITPGTKIIKVYKYEPQILELGPRKISENTYVIPLGNIGTDKQTILIKMEIPQRPTGEYREGLFSIELDTSLTAPLIIKRSEDLDAIKQSLDSDIKAQFTEADINIHALRAMDKTNVNSEKEKEIFTKRLEEIQKDNIMTQKLGTKVQELVETQKIMNGTKKVSEEELKERKSGLTKKRD
ncbi:MAG: vWA domain-containing protein [Thermoplasmata archaeon]